MELLFEWDADKAESNWDKHRVSFAEGATVFNDLFVATMPDPDHSDDERRYIALGLSAKGHLLVVVYAERGNKTRLISCRRATPVERKAYEESNA
jgi:uncharacterized DUF497 family protein